MSEYLIQRETLTSLCDAYRSLLLVEDTSLIGIEELTSFIGNLPMKIHHYDSVYSIEDGVLTADLPSVCFSADKETKIIIKTSPGNEILECSCRSNKPLYVQHGIISGFDSYDSTTTTPASTYLSIDSGSHKDYYTVTWNVTDSSQVVYNSTAELWIVTKS